MTMPDNTPVRRRMHLAEMLLELRLHGKEDAFRKTTPFSRDITATNAVLFDPRYSNRAKVTAYRNWLVNASGLNRRPSCASSVNTGRKATAMTSSAKKLAPPTSFTAEITTW